MVISTNFIAVFINLLSNNLGNMCMDDITCTMYVHDGVFDAAVSVVAIDTSRGTLPSSLIRQRCRTSWRPKAGRWSPSSILTSRGTETITYTR